MVRITVEIVPYGIEECAKVIGRGYITNDGTGTETVGNYNGEFYFGNLVHPKKVRVEGWKRGDFSVWDLIRKSLRNAHRWRLEKK